MRNSKKSIKLIAAILTLLSFSTALTLPAYSSVGPSTLVSVLSKFQGVNIFDACSQTCLAPDPQVAAGPNHIAEIVNFIVRVFQKDGTVMQTKTLPSLFNAGTDLLNDPRLLYDAQSQRWFSSASDLTTNTVKVAASLGPDPTSGPWKVTTLQPSGGACPDQPLLGVSDDKVIVTANNFSSTCVNPFRGVQYWIVNKNDLINGVSPPNIFTPPVDSTTASIYPVHSLSPTSTEFMVSTGLNSSNTSRQAFSNTLTLYAVTGTPGVTNVTTTSQSLPLSPRVTAPPYAAEPGVPGLLATSTIRVQDAKWRGEKLWLGLNNSCNPSGDSSNRSCARIIQIDTGTSTVTRNFDISKNGVDYFYPALAIDNLGNLDIIFGFSSLNDYPSLAATGHIDSDSPDSWAPPQTIVSGSALVASGRYGDYFGAGVDPSNPTVAWVAGQYHTSATGNSCAFNSCWSTYIASVKVAPALSTSFTYSRQSTNIKSPVTFTGDASGGAPPYDFSWTFGDGITTTGNSPTHTFSKAGVYTITLTASDSIGQQASSSQSLVVTITPDQEFQIDLSDYDNNGIANFVDVANVAFYWGKACISLSGTEQNTCAYWDWNLDGKIDIVDIAHAAYWFSFQTDVGVGSPSYTTDLKWHGCAILSGDSYNYCVARGL